VDRVLGDIFLTVKPDVPMYDYHAAISSVAISPVGDVASPPAVPGGFSCHQCTAIKVTGARKHTRLCDGLCTSLHGLQNSWLTAVVIISPLLHGEDIRVNRC